MSLLKKLVRYQPPTDKGTRVTYEIDSDVVELYAEESGSYFFFMKDELLMMAKVFEEIHGVSKAKEDRSTVKVSDK